MIYVVVVTSIVLFVAAGLLADGAASVRAAGQHTISAHVRARFPLLIATVRSQLALQVYNQLQATKHTGVSTAWQNGTIDFNPADPTQPAKLCNDANDATCALNFGATGILAGCSGLSTQSASGDVVDSANINQAAYVADEQRCAISVRYSVYNSSFAQAYNGTYAMGTPGVYLSDQRRFTFRIFATSPYAVLVGVDRDVDFDPDHTASLVADVSGNGTIDQSQTYDPFNPAAYSDTMIHGIAGEAHRPGAGCNEGQTWGAQNAPAIELDGGCNDSAPAPNPLPNGPYDFPNSAQWSSAANQAKW